MSESKYFTATLVPCMLCVLFACACAPETTVEGVLGLQAQGPTFLGCAAVSPERITFSFDTPVSVTALRFDPPVEIAKIEDGAVVQANFAVPLAPGTPMTADLLVKDGKGNTLNVLTSLRSRNNQFPALVLTEIRTEYSKPKVEFVEFRTESPGQLGALRLVTTSLGFATPLFEFPQVQVSPGEYVVVHLRTLDSQAVNEVGSDLLESTVTESTPGRDFWVSGAEKRIHKTDAIALLDQDGNVLDGVLLSETMDGPWLKDELKQGAAYLSSHHAWKASAAGQTQLLPQDGVPSGPTTTTRTICRDEGTGDTDGTENWYVTATSCATPGLPNKSDRYVAPVK
jgi:hypothetical protein